MRKILVVLGVMISIDSLSQLPVIQWQKTLGGSMADEAECVQHTRDGGYIVTGNTMSNDGDVTGNHGNYDCWVLKLDSTGMLQWQKTLGGSNADFASSIQETIDGGYIIAGHTNSNDGDVTGYHGDTDFWIVKLNSTGVLQWQKTLGGSKVEYSKSIKQTIDKGYIVAGNTRSNDGDVVGLHGSFDDWWIVKLDSTGMLQWQKTLGGSDVDYANSIQLTKDGGYIIAGMTSSYDGDVTGFQGVWDYWIVKLDSTGILQWQKTLGGTSLDDATSIQQTNDGGFIVAGGASSNNGDVTNNHGGRDYWIVKLDSTGTLKWQRTLGGSDLDFASSIQQTSDGGYIVIGNANSNNGNVIGNQGNQDYWVVKLDSTGVLQWQKALGGSFWEQAANVQQTNDGGYIVAGYSASNDGDVTGNHGNFDFWVVKLALAPLPLKLLSFNAKLQTPNSVALNWQTANEVNVSHFNMQRSNNGKDFTSIGKVNASCCSYEFIDDIRNLELGIRNLFYRLEMVDKDGSKTYSEIRNVELGIRNGAISVYPNPAKDIVNIECLGAKELLIIDYLGRTVYRSTVNSQPLTVNTKQLTKGIFIVKAMMNNGDIKTEKLVVE